jgi:hypothetical protein
MKRRNLLQVVPASILLSMVGKPKEDVVELPPEIIAQDSLSYILVKIDGRDVSIPFYGG